MLIVMEINASKGAIDNICKLIEEMGLTAHPMPGAQRTAIGVTGNKSQVDSDRIMTQPGVKEIIHVTKPYKLVSREFYPESSVIDVDGVKVGGDDFVIIAGPCSVENRDQLFTIAESVAKSGAKILRGGAYKPRTSPYSFQGLKEEGLKIL
ncbi:MAG: 3-deoxy-7-phosphoheptulonate synthase, partial [bacterium]